MDIDNIKVKYENLSYELKQALSKMELTDRVVTIRDEIKDLQRVCPHNNGSFDFSQTEECPYCGRHFRR